MQSNTPKTPEEYREELMRIYQSRHPASPEPAPAPQPEPPCQPEPQPPAPPAPEPMPEPVQPPELPEPEPMPEPPVPPAEPEPEPAPLPMEPEEPMPVPVEPEPMQPPETPMPAMEEAAEAPEEPPEQAAPMEQIRTLPRDLPPGMPDVPPAVPSTANGWLKVIVRTGNNAMPLAGVTIMISSHDTGTMRLEQVAITNESGETERIPLPAPELAESFTLGGVPTYSIYTVSAYAPGYFRQESTDVPVFPGITSLQQFNLIPMPLYADGESDTAPPYSNQEPQF